MLRDYVKFAERMCIIDYCTWDKDTQLLTVVLDNGQIKVEVKDLPTREIAEKWLHNMRLPVYYLTS